MAVEILKRAPTIGRDMLRLFWAPKAFAREWKSRTEAPPSNAEVLAWGTGLAAVILSLYALVHGHTITDTLSRTAVVPIPAMEYKGPAPVPSISGVFWDFSGGGFGFDYPEYELKGPKQPQTIAFQMGVTTVYLSNAIPERVGEKVPTVLLTVIFIYVALCCVYPAVLIWNHDVRPSMSLSFMYLYIAMLFGLLTLFSIVEITILTDGFHLTGWALALATTPVNTILGLLFFRSFWSAFRTLYGVTRLQFFGSMIFAWGLTAVVLPVTAPVIWLVLRFQSIIEVLR